MPVMQMKHDIDPAEDIIDRVGDLSEVAIPLNKVLVGIYMRPAKTTSGIHLPDEIRDEDRYQGKAGLILKKGPMAFVDDEKVQFSGLDPQVGDWVAFRPSNGLKIDIRKVHCILLSDTHIEMAIPTPDMIF